MESAKRSGKRREETNGDEEEEEEFKLDWFFLRVESFWLSVASLRGEVEGRPDVISCEDAAVGEAAGERMVRSGCPSSSADGGVAGLTRDGEEGKSGRL